MAVEVGIASLAAERAQPERLDELDQLALAIDGMLEDFTAYRQADIRLHVGLAEATDCPRLVTSMTEIQGAMSGLISLIAHPPEVLDSSNLQHRRLLAAVRRRDVAAAAREMTDHVRGTEHILAGLLPPIGSGGRG
jgi:GntR family transcriptional repressor for pyruvate dehydrogenase complex